METKNFLGNLLDVRLPHAYDVTRVEHHPRPKDETMTTLETIYTVTKDENEDGGHYYTVRDAEGDDVADYETLRDATVEADERNTNAAISDVLGAIECNLTDLTESRRLSTLKALQAILSTTQKLVEDEQ